MNEMSTRLEAKFEGDMRVCVRCGGKGQEMLGKLITVKTKGGEWRSVRLVELVEDYGAGDVCVFVFDWE